MLFNSISFAIFLPIVFFLYWRINSKALRSQNLLLLLASYFFYGYWNWHFLFLLVFSTSLDYYTGLRIYKSTSSKGRKTWLFISVFANLGFLGFFKYYNFFLSSASNIFDVFGIHADFVVLHVLLPIGISFYTFHGLSYVFDIYNRRIKPTTNFIEYSLFVSFFPLLVAGPIERATHLLPQIEQPREFDYSKAADGLKQILWGLFKKMVIADNCSLYANAIFNHPNSYASGVLVFGALMFAFQIYGDFSGYSDIALGTARLFGFDLLKNFSYPYFSRSIAEFWRRWHISLSSWFKDYLYIPLGGSRGNTWTKIRNVFIVFLLSGFWHGANWTFIVWGGLNALFILPSVIVGANRNHLDIVAHDKSMPTIRELLQMLSTFMLTTIAWIFFRANSVKLAFEYIRRMVTFQPGLGRPTFGLTALPFLILLLILFEWNGRENNYALEKIGVKWPRPVRWGLYCLIVFTMGMYMKTEHTQFIYFQF
jgi:alginate O-acetyltransferase complex protein AlgI